MTEPAAAEPAKATNKAAIGWTWVGGQALLVGLLVFLPARDDWPTPGWLQTIAAIALYGGLAIVVLAALKLGAGFTPTPVPNQRGTLSTGGVYRYVRHPVYTGMFAIVAGVALGSGSWVRLAIAVITIIFFDRKASWEEERLAERFDGYPAYAAITPKFVPQPWHHR